MLDEVKEALERLLSVVEVFGDNRLVLRSVQKELDDFNILMAYLPKEDIKRIKNMEEYKKLESILQ